ncbi:MAG: hypothetical protein B6I37_03120 [Desulfobacteraceae bacterium 4572_35.2]|nr:MAG: hypothetical protein B6I37_03120 [Desulfobacteraceae bacterium 4572_35.2]
MNRLMLFILLVLCAVGAPELSVAEELMATPQATYSLQSAKTYYTAGETEAALSTLRRYTLFFICNALKLINVRCRHRY